MRLAIIDHITDPGRQGGESDDRFGWNDHSVYVIDGATGIAGRQVMAGFSSDAAWLADLAARRFGAAGPSTAIETVRAINSEARDIYCARAGAVDLPRYAWPAAAFQMLCVEGRRLIAYGLGDCRLFLQRETDGALFETTALKGSRDAEIEAARRHLERIGGFQGAADIAGDDETMAALRAGRSRHNTPDGRVFTLGLVPEAADRVVREEVALDGAVRGLVCSDGFAALTDNYGAYSAAELIEAAFDGGLKPLLERLRRIERLEDSEGRKFPRYKVSDDATAIAFRLMP